MKEQGYDVAARLQLLEDRMAIYDLIATHPLSADTGDETFINAIYTDDVVFERGAGLTGARGREEMVDFVASPAHRQALAGGLAHFGNLPFVRVGGDRAFAMSYIMLMTPDHGGEKRELSNHGATNGFRVHRVIANRWKFERSAEGWRIRERRMLSHDGSAAVRELIGEAKEFLDIRA